jgi:beta-galactosidase
MYYGVDYYPEQWPRERWDTDARLMQQAGINLVRMGEFAWSLLEPKQGHYAMQWLDEAIELLSHYGIVTVLGTPTAAPPAWLCHAYPEILRMTPNGQRVTFGMRRQYCPGSDLYGQFSTKIVVAMAEHYAQNPHVIGWQIDNELGCHDSTRCYCPECQKRFQLWCKQNYESLDALNAAWGTVFWSQIYTAWEQIPLPWSATGVSNPSLELDFWRFSSDQMIAYQSTQIEILCKQCPEKSITTNLMSFDFQDIDYFGLAKRLDYVSWDNYPLLTRCEPADIALSHATMRSLKDRPFWVMEQQAGPTGWQTIDDTPKPGQLRLWAYQALAHGADAMVYFRWRTCPFNTEMFWHGILDHDGIPRRRYEEIAQVGQELGRIGRHLVGGTSPKAAAMILSYDSSFALKLQPNAKGMSYSDLFSRFYRALHELHVPVDMVPPDADLTPYRLVIAPTLHLVREEWAANLERYVQQGGWLVIGPRSGVKDSTNCVTTETLPGLLRDLCGIEVVEYIALGEYEDNAILFESQTMGTVQADLADAVCATHIWCEILDPFAAETLARYTDGYYANKPAITLRRSDSGGGAVYVGTMGNKGLYTVLSAWLVARSHLAPLLKAPKGVEIAARERNGTSYLFVLNHTDEEQLVRIPYPSHDLISDRAVETWTTIEPYGVYVLVAT